MSDPAKGYHLEFDCTNEEKAAQLQELIRGFDIEARIIRRKKYHVVYLKEGAGIVDLLNVCEAPVSLMNMENLRIIKEMRNSVNRRVNCETANIAKTVNAASRQVEDIEYIRKHYGFQNLPDSLREMAEMRLEYPDVPLKELLVHLLCKESDEELYGDCMNEEIMTWVDDNKYEGYEWYIACSVFDRQ